MEQGRRPARWINLVLLFVLPGAACGLLPLLNSAASPGGAGILAPGQALPFSNSITSMAGAPSATMTPFLPVENTPTPAAPTAAPVVVIEPEGLLTAQELLAMGSAELGTAAAPEAAALEVAIAPVDPFRWHGLDLSGAGGALRLVISPPETVSWGNPVEVAFPIGYPCEYADHRACVSAHEDGRLLLATVHSGVGGEGQLLRHALEGTGFNRAGYGLGQIAANVSALVGAPVSAEQDRAALNDLRVVAAGRVPASAVEEYFSLPFDEALRLADFTLDEELARARAGESALLVIETCGWRHPEEAWAPGISDTTGSVYLVVLGN